MCYAAPEMYEDKYEEDFKKDFSNPFKFIPQKNSDHEAMERFLRGIAANLLHALESKSKKQTIKSEWFKVSKGIYARVKRGTPIRIIRAIKQWLRF